MTTCRSCHEEFKPAYGECEACGGDGEIASLPDSVDAVPALGDLSILLGRSMVGGLLQDTVLLACAVESLVTLAHCAGIPEETILSHFDVYPAKEYAEARLALIS